MWLRVWRELPLGVVTAPRLSGDTRAELSRGRCRSDQKSRPEGETALAGPHRGGGAVGAALAAAQALRSAPRYGRAATGGRTEGWPLPRVAGSRARR